jgi:hypothetical protein
MDRPSARTWVWVALGVQFAGYLFDALWHGVLRPGVEPQTVADMAWHLATVHLPLYLGSGGVLVTTAMALRQEMKRPLVGAVPWLAVAGAVISLGAELWHAYSHLRLDTHTGPIAGAVSSIGFVIVVAAMWLSSEHRRRAGGAKNARRAA